MRNVTGISQHKIQMKILLILDPSSILMAAAQRLFPRCVELWLPMPKGKGQQLQFITLELMVTCGTPCIQGAQESSGTPEKE
jgi:hypothetical protein